MTQLNPQEVLDYWFGALDPDSEMIPDKARQLWFQKSDATDQHIIEHFGDHIARAAAGAYDHWLDDPESRVAFVVLIDQFSRNAHRGSPLSWAFDAKCREVVREAYNNGHYDAVHPAKRVFLLLPLEHAEDLALQEECIERFEALADSRESEEAREFYRSWIEWAVKHRDIIARFGRFPHRNEIIGRESTPEEIEFLKQPGSGF